MNSAFAAPRSVHAPLLKITGFGLSKSAIEQSMPKTRVPTAAVYSPPELLAAGYGPLPYDGAACDAWACGVCLYCAPRRCQAWLHSLHALLSAGAGWCTATRVRCGAGDCQGVTAYATGKL